MREADIQFKSGGSEDVLGGVSQPRNTVIAAIFYRFELIRPVR
jgi:predicted HTH transcriptional regulator